MQRILITGAAGFIGSHICMELAGRGFQIVAIDNLSPGADLILKQWRISQIAPNRNVVFYHADSSGPSVLFRLIVQYKPAAIIHLAGGRPVCSGFSDPIACLQNTLAGVGQVLEAARRTGTGKVVLASSILVYEGLPAPFAEDSLPPRPRSPLAVGDAASEGLCHAFHNRYDLDIIILRYSHVYGPGSPSGDTLTALLLRVLAGRTTALDKTGPLWQDYVYIDDICRGTIEALNLDGYQVINLGGGCCHTPATILSIIQRCTGPDVMCWEDFYPYAETGTGWADITKARELLNWSPRILLEQGLAETLCWMRQHWSWMKKLPVLSTVSPVWS